MSRTPIAPSPAALRALRRRDPRLAAAMKQVPRYPGFPHREQTRMSHYQFLARAICFQQLAGKAAATIHGRVCALTSGSAFPRPAEFLRLPDRRLRGAGLSANKTRALRDLATRLEDGRLRLRAAARLPDETVIERLVQVHGIGVWSAQMFLLFRLGRLDVMPVTDLGVQEGLRRIHGLPQRPGPAEVEERTADWAPLRSVGAWACWRMTEVELPE